MTFICEMRPLLLSALLTFSCGSDTRDKDALTLPQDPTAAPIFIIDNSVGLPTTQVEGFQLDWNIGQPLVTELSAPPFKLQSGFIPQTQLKR
jgi:hypothetical protein